MFRDTSELRSQLVSFMHVRVREQCEENNFARCEENDDSRDSHNGAVDAHITKNHRAGASTETHVFVFCDSFAKLCDRS